MENCDKIDIIGSIGGVFFHDVYFIHSEQKWKAVWIVYIYPKQLLAEDYIVAYIITNCLEQPFEIVRLLRNIKLLSYGTESTNKEDIRLLAKWFIYNISIHLSDIYEANVTTLFKFTIRQIDNVVLKREKMEKCVNDATVAKFAYLCHQCSLNYNTLNNVCILSEAMRQHIDNLEFCIKTELGTFLSHGDSNYDKNTNIDYKKLSLGDIFTKVCHKVYINNDFITINYIKPNKFNILYTNKDCQLDCYALHVVLETLYNKCNHVLKKERYGNYIMFNKTNCHRKTIFGSIFPSFPFVRIKYWENSPRVSHSTKLRIVQESFFNDFAILVDIATPLPDVIGCDLFLGIDSLTLNTLTQFNAKPTLWPLNRLELNPTFCMNEECTLSITRCNSLITINYVKCILSFFFKNTIITNFENIDILLIHLYNRCSPQIKNVIDSVYCDTTKHILMLAKKYNIEWLAVEYATFFLISKGQDFTKVKVSTYKNKMLKITGSVLYSNYFFIF